MKQWSSKKSSKSNAKACPLTSIACCICRRYLLSAASPGIQSFKQVTHSKGFGANTARKGSPKGFKGYEGGNSYALGADCERERGGKYKGIDAVDP